MSNISRISRKSFMGIVTLTSFAISIHASDLFAGFDDYLDEIKANSVIRSFPRGVRKALKEAHDHDTTPLYGRALALKHVQFDRSKKTLIGKWEATYGIAWPTYSADVYSVSVDGRGREVRRRIRKAGHQYDAHHILPQSHNGPNVYWNLVPLTVGNHNRFHSPTSTLGNDCCTLFARSCGQRVTRR